VCAGARLALQPLDSRRMASVSHHSVPLSTTKPHYRLNIGLAYHTVTYFIYFMASILFFLEILCTCFSYIEKVRKKNPKNKRQRQKKENIFASLDLNSAAQMSVADKRFYFCFEHLRSRLIQYLQNKYVDIYHLHDLPALETLNGIIKFCQIISRIFTVL
jgi:hypothetical protein